MDGSAGHAPNMSANRKNHHAEDSSSAFCPMVARRGHSAHIDHDGHCRRVHAGMCPRDMQILMLVEDRESRSTMSVEKLRDAMLTMLHARIVCNEGHVLDAITIYDSIAESIAPNPVQFGRTRPPEIQ